MKKKILTLALAVVLVSVFALPVFAAPTTVYFYDTYGEIKSDPLIRWGDKNWGGWEAFTMKDEGGGWYSYELSNDIVAGFNMLIFTNKPDDSAGAIQYVWHVDRGAPAGVYFASDHSKDPNPNENNFEGIQYDASSYATKAAADAAHGTSTSTSSGGDKENPKTGDGSALFIAFGAIALTAGAALLIGRKVKA